MRKKYLIMLFAAITLIGVAVVVVCTQLIISKPESTYQIGIAGFVVDFIATIIAVKIIVAKSKSDPSVN